MPQFISEDEDLVYEGLGEAPHFGWNAEGAH